MAYASRTGTRRNLAALRERGWRLLLSPEGVLRDEGFEYMLDNGAWTAHTQQRPWDQEKFEKALDSHGRRADMVVVPDWVMGGLDSLRFSLEWLPVVQAATDGRVLLAVQDGMEDEHLEEHLSERVGIFIGGSTEWKIATLRRWCRLARKMGTWCHVGRVNTVKRIKMCLGAGADSFDGTAASRYAVELPKLDNARRLMTLPLEE